MKVIQHTRRDFSVRLAALLPASCMAEKAFAVPPGDREGISRTAESIHQEVVFNATRRRVYEAIFEEKQFRQVTNFIIPGASTQISTEVGGSFAMFSLG